MKKRQKLGQHFLTSQNIANSIVNFAEITDNETVLEIGTGKGILIPLLCERAKKVISIEADRELYDEAQSQFSNLKNLILIHGDGFKTKEQFDVLVSNLPYSKSREAIEWLAQREFSRAIVMVQKEFAQKLISTKAKRAITVLANHGLDISTLMSVGKNNFKPPPKVDSVVLMLKKKRTISKSLILTINRMFSYKRKTLKSIMKKFGIENSSDKRLDDLTGDEIIKIANQINK